MQYTPFIFISLSLASLFLFPFASFNWRNSWFIYFILTCSSAYLLNQMDLVALLITALIFSLAWVTRYPQLPVSWRSLSLLLFIVFALGLGLHVIPGFNSLLVIEPTRFSEDAKTFQLFMNIDKTLIAIFILGLIYQQPGNIKTWRYTLGYLVWYIPCLILLLLLTAFLAGYLQFEPKLIDKLGFWIWANLMTCIAEEVFFRGLVQQQLANKLKIFIGGRWIALIIASILFGIAHIAGGWTYVMLSILAGLGYGLIYQLSGRIEASILTHFSVNLAHVTLFTYPALSAA